MRKLLFIVLAFTACLLFPEGGDGACIRQQAPSAAFSAGDMHTDEWLTRDQVGGQAVLGRQ